MAERRLEEKVRRPNIHFHFQFPSAFGSATYSDAVRYGTEEATDAVTF